MVRSRKETVKERLAKAKSYSSGQDALGMLSEEQPERELQFLSCKFLTTIGQSKTPWIMKTVSKLYKKLMVKDKNLSGSEDLFTPDQQ